MMSRLLRPVDIAWLAAFRIFYGLSLTVSMFRFLGYGWIDRLFVEPRFFFKYWGFGWVEPLSSGSMHLLFWGLAFCAFSTAIGFAFRITSVLFALGLTYIQLIDVSNYLNHYYLAALIAWMLSASPASQAYSVDAYLKRRLGFARGPSKKTTAAGWLYLFRFQVGVVYTFAGVAKMGSDWLLHGQPLRIWLGAKADLPVLGWLFTIDAVPLIMSWCGFLFDISIVAWLSYRKTRPYAYLVVIAFHILTRLLLPIGMFPIIMVLSALVFFSPSWPRIAKAKVLSFFQRAEPKAPETGDDTASGEATRAPGRRPSWVQKTAIALGVLYCSAQLLMPLRFLVYGDNVLWHEQGMRYAWRVMLRAKGGQTTFHVHQLATGRTFHVSPRDYLTGLQEAEMSSQPDLILQLGQHIQRDFEARGFGPVEVRVDSRVSLNGRRSVPFIDPNVDLTTLKDGLGRISFVMPAPTGDPPHTRPVR